MFKSISPEASVLPLSLPDQRTAVGSTTCLIILAFLLAVAAAFSLFIDLPVAQFIKTQALPRDLRTFVKLSEVFGWGGTVAMIILTATVLDARGWRVIPGLAFCTFASGALANFVKQLVARDRPSVADLSGPVSQTFVAWLPLLQEPMPADRNGFQVQSFPSAHTATATGLAIGLSILYPRGRWLFAAFAVLAALQRMETQAHFASDVFAGAALACLIAAWQVGARTRLRRSLKIDLA